MKIFVLIITLIIGVAFPISAQQTKPEKVYSIVKVYKELSWYTTQYNLWEKELEKNQTNENGWTNIYAAARMAKILSTTDTEKEKWVANMQNIVTKMEKQIPNTYAYYYIKSWDNSIWNAKSEKEFEQIASYAENAYKLDPDRPSVYPDLINLYSVKNNTTKLKEIAIKWRNSGDLSPNILAINYNMLISTNKNAILLTAGDNDTYPAIVLQQSEGVRTDVFILNIYLASQSPEYRNAIFKNAAIPKLEGKNLDQQIIINHIIKHKKEKPLFFAFGDFFLKNETLKDKLYNVGMALRYSKKEFNNTSVLINNFENKFLLDQLTFSCYKDLFPEQVKRHNFWYVPGLIILYDHYCLAEDDRKKLSTKKKILSIIAGTPHEEKILPFLND